MARVMPEPVEVGSCLKYDVASAPLAPHRGDVSAAELIYGHARVAYATANWRRAGERDPSLKEDFLWRPETVSKHSSWPIDTVTETAEMIVNDMFFPAVKLSPIPLERLLDPNDDKTMVQNTSAGYYYRVLHKEKYHPGLKSTESVIDHVQMKTREFLHLLATADSTEQIDKWISDNESLLAARLLDRRAVAKEPKIRTVYDVSYLTNLVIGRFSAAFRVWVSSISEHPLMSEMDPITFSTHMTSLIAEDEDVLDSDISKFDKRLRFWAQRRFLARFLSCFEITECSHDSMVYGVTALLLDCVICTPWAKKYRRRSRLALSGAYIIQTMESWMSSIIIVRAAVITMVRTSVNPLRRFGVLADDMLMLIVKYVRQEYCRWLLHCADYFECQLKDGVISVGSVKSYKWLGYSVVGGIAALDEDKLIVLHYCSPRDISEQITDGCKQ